MAATFLEVALACVRRGMFVFPCKPQRKNPLTEHGFKDASNSRDTIEAWWGSYSDANVAIATGASGLCAVDVDHGIANVEELESWMASHNLPRTYAVRTGRRPEFGVQLYYSGTGLKSTGWHDGDIKGDIRCSTGYVMSSGSIHPQSKQAYEVLWDVPIVPVPEYIATLTTQARERGEAVTVDDETADGWKTWLLEYMAHYQIEPRDFEKRAPNGWWLGIHCPWEYAHTTGAGDPSSTALGILDGKIAFNCEHHGCKAAKRDTASLKALVTVVRGDYVPEPGADPVAILGRKPTIEVVTDWRDLFHTNDDVRNCPPPTFLIDSFLAKQSICAIAAPVGQRKSLIALNIAHSLCTGAPLFGSLPVVNRPSRVLYLCPEMGLISIADRVNRIGLIDSVGASLFLRSMNLGNLELTDIPEAALDGSVLIIDTAIRFMVGDENSSKDMQAFSEVLFNLQRVQGPDGAILTLYHSPKSTKDASELTLENCMRGSGELGAAVTDAHGTRLQDPTDPYKSLSFIRHIKCRDYEGVDDFEVAGDRATGLLNKVGNSKAVLSIKNPGNKADKDGMDAAAKALIAANPDMKIPALMQLLKEAGIKRGKTWVSEARLAIRGVAQLTQNDPKSDRRR